jgi:histidinol dehydrogenase
MKIIRADAAEFAEFFNKLRLRGGTFTPELLATVAEIIRDVTARGDKALFEYTAKFDGHELTAATVEVTDKERKSALALVASEDLEVIKLAAGRIEKYHRHQITQGFMVKNESGVELGQRILPLRRVGIYAPGGKASYPSTLLMAAIPARIAGVEEIIVVSPSKDGQLNPLIAAAAQVSGVQRIFKIGGAQAIAALAYGTKTIPLVDKIVGPGNAYVAAAKKLVFGQVAIDMIAGPSEVVIIADKTANASFVAADILAQAEHDEMAAAVLLTPLPDLAHANRSPASSLIEKKNNRGISKQIWSNYSYCRHRSSRGTGQSFRAGTSGIDGGKPVRNYQTGAQCRFSFSGFVYTGSIGRLHRGHQPHLADTRNCPVFFATGSL